MTQHTALRYLETVPPSQPRPPRVVIVDDDASVLVAFRRLLQRSCDVVACVSDGDHAVDAASTLRPDVMVIDLMMPEVDGLEVCRRVKLAVPDTNIVIVTAFDDLQMQRIALQIGASAFVPKHSVATELEETILRIFANTEETS